MTKAKAPAIELVRCFCNKYGCNGDLTARSTCRRHAAADFQRDVQLGSASNLPSLFSDPIPTQDPDDLLDPPEAVEEFEDPLTNPLDELFDSIDIDSKLYPDNPTSNITLGEVLLSMFDLIAAHNRSQEKRQGDVLHAQPPVLAVPVQSKRDCVLSV